MAGPESMVRERWQRAKGSSLGRWLFSRGVGKFAPYTGTIGARIEALEPGRSEVTMRDRKAIRNHLNSIHAVALAPVLVYRFRRQAVSPYLEIGLGATYVTGKHISARDLSTHFLFEDRLGIGIMGDVHNIGFKAFHYSNARIKQPNDGVNVFLLCYTFSR